MAQTSLGVGAAGVLIAVLCAAASEPEDVPFSDAEIGASRFLSEWCGLWASPPLTGASFSHQRSYAARERDFSFAKYVERVGSWEELSRILVFSPDGQWAVDYMCGQLCEIRGHLSWCGSADSQVALVAVGSWEGSTLLHVGPSWQYHMAAWLSPTAFVVGGCHDREGHGDLRLAIWRFDTVERTVSVYDGPELGRDDLQDYWRRLKRWRSSRFPEIDW